MLIQYAALRIEPNLANSDTPLAAAGGAMFAGGLVLMTVGAMVSIFGTKSGVALISPRNLYALSREGMLPGFLGWVSPRYATPVVSIWITGTLVVILATNLHRLRRGRDPRRTPQPRRELPHRTRRDPCRRAPPPLHPHKSPTHSQRRRNKPTESGESRQPITR